MANAYPGDQSLRRRKVHSVLAHSRRRLPLRDQSTTEQDNLTSRGLQYLRTILWPYLRDRQLSVPGRVLQRRRAVIQSPVDVGALVHPQQLRHVLHVSVGAGVDQLLCQPPVKVIISLVLSWIAAILVLVPKLLAWFSLFSFRVRRLSNSKLTCSWLDRKSLHKYSC